MTYLYFLARGHPARDPCLVSCFSCSEVLTLMAFLPPLFGALSYEREEEPEEGSGEMKEPS